MPDRIDILFQKFIDGTCSRQEYDELMDMLRENQQEERIKQMLQQVYQATSRSLRSVTYVDTNGLLQSTTETPVVEMTPPAGRKRWRTIMAAAAILLLLLGGGWWALNKKQGGEMAQHVATESSIRKFTQRAEQKYLLLPDSTQVWLNAASSLEFPETFQTGKREVYLVGEAFFDVKHAAHMPFLIHTGNVTTRVVGTAFNIKAYPDQPDIIVAVKRGKVQVSKNEKLIATLTMGQQVTVTAAAQQADIQPTKESRVADWTTGQLSYTSRPLGDILKDLERNYNVTIELTAASLEQEIVTTSFRRDIGVGEALDILCGLTDTQLKKENGKYLISRKQH
jgi:ferric-dicitrate binding protein FerR (iron transport regulator)